MLNKILIIKHGALGDWLLSTGAFKLIRANYPQAHITLLTNTLYSPLALQSSWFDEVMIDDRQGIIRTIKILLCLRKKKFTHVFDIQRSQRTDIYYRFLKRSKLFWSGRVKGSAGYFVDKPEAHILERIALQLRACGIPDFPKPDVSWLRAEFPCRPVQGQYALIIPGAAGHGSQKKWTASGYIELINWLEQQDIQCIVLGTVIDSEIIDAIKQSKPDILVYYKRPLAELADLARGAILSVGGDTGPLHLMALAGSPCVALFGLKLSNIKKCGAIGKLVRSINVEDLQSLTAREVIEAAKELIYSEARADLNRVCASIK